MQIQNLNVVCERAIDRTTKLPYWVARGTGSIRPIVAYGPTRSEAFLHAITLIKEQGAKLEVVK